MISTMKPTISAVIAVKNEEKNIKGCLENIKDLVDEIIIVDDNSTDKTLEIAKRYTTKIFKRTNPVNKSVEANKNLGFSKATKEWILLIDADERIPIETKKEILEKIKIPEYTAYSFCFDLYAFSKFLDFKFWNNMRVIRLFRKEKTYYKKEIPHEILTVNGKVGEIEGHIINKAIPDVASYMAKTNLWSSLDAERIFKEKKGGLLKKKRIVKMGFYSLAIEPLLYFLFLYFYKGLIKRGYKGLILSWMSMNYLFLERAKVWELQNIKKQR